MTSVPSNSKATAPSSTTHVSDAPGPGDLSDYDDTLQTQRMVLLANRSSENGSPVRLSQRYARWQTATAAADAVPEVGEPIPKADTVCRREQAS
jgi:hypothetical protein